jgi:hypothetical protein
MSKRPGSRSIPATPVITLLAALFATGAEGQQAALRSHVGAGFVINGPHQFTGFSAQALTLALGGLGVYVDTKFDRSSPAGDREFDPALTAEQAEDRFGDPLYSEESSWRSFNVAVLRPVLPELILYGGVGASRQKHYRSYYDESFERGLRGFYTVEDPRETGNRVNLLGGAFFRISPTILVQFGVETMPRGITVGGVYTFPLH